MGQGVESSNVQEFPSPPGDRCAAPEELTTVGLAVTFFLAVYSCFQAIGGIREWSARDGDVIIIIALAMVIIWILLNPLKTKQAFANASPYIRLAFFTVVKRFLKGLNFALVQLLLREDLFAEKDQEEEMTPLTDGKAQVKKVCLIKSAVTYFPCENDMVKESGTEAGANVDCCRGYDEGEGVGYGAQVCPPCLPAGQTVQIFARRSRAGTKRER